MAKIPFRSLDGVLLLDKNRNVSSNKALQDARFMYRAKKAGHTGTLDPFATGLLAICFGEANKYSRWLLNADKTYHFTAILGQHSTTGDTEGQINVIDEKPSIDEHKLRLAEQAFLGEISQTPPKYSAIKIDGQRAYDLARAGKDFVVPARQVIINSLSLTVENNILTGITRVSKGTYIRTLVEDIGAYVGTTAYCKELRRLQVADLVSDDNNVARKMRTIEDIHSISEEALRDELLIPMDILCCQFPKQDILVTHWEMLIRGKKTKIDSQEHGIVRLYLDKSFCGLGELYRGQLKAFRLLNTGF